MTDKMSDERRGEIQGSTLGLLFIGPPKEMQELRQMIHECCNELDRLEAENKRLQGDITDLRGYLSDEYRKVADLEAEIQKGIANCLKNHHGRIADLEARNEELEQSYLTGELAARIASLEAKLKEKDTVIEEVRKLEPVTVLFVERALEDTPKPPVGQDVQRADELPSSSGSDDKCPTCNGTGAIEYRDEKYDDCHDVPCPDCKGKKPKPKKEMEK